MGATLVGLLSYTLSYATVQNTKQDSLAYNALEKIMKLPDHPKAVDEIQKEAIKRKTARYMIFALADSIGDRNGRSTNKEVHRVMNLFEKSFRILADRYFGNKNDQYESEEFEKMQGKVSEYPGLDEVRKMMWGYLE